MKRFVLMAVALASTVAMAGPARAAIVRCGEFAGLAQQNQDAAAGIILGHIDLIDGLLCLGRYESCGCMEQKLRNEDPALSESLERHLVECVRGPASHPVYGAIISTVQDVCPF